MRPAPVVVSFLLAACGASTPPGATTPEPPTDNGNGVAATCALPRVIAVTSTELARITPVDPAAMAAWAAAHVAEVDAEVERNRYRYDALEERRRAQHVMIARPEDPAALPAARARAEAILARALAGEAFDALAREATDDFGAWDQPLDWFPRGMMVAEFEEACFSATAPGVVPHVVETHFGFHVIRVVGLRPAGTDADALQRADAIERLYEAPRAEAGRARLAAALAEVRDGRSTLEAALEGLFGRLRGSLTDVVADPLRASSEALYFGPYGRRAEAAPIEAIHALGEGEVLPQLLSFLDSVLVIVGGAHPPISDAACTPVARADDPDLRRLLREELGEN